MSAFRVTPTGAPPRSRSRQKILDAALGAFSKRGFHETRMDDIASLAGVAKGTLYYNFPSKSDLFVALVCEGMNRFIEALNRDMVSDLPFPEHFRRLVMVQVDLLLSWSDLFVVARNPGGYGFDEDVVERVEAARDLYVDFVSGMIRQGQDQGYLLPCDPEVVASGILGLLDGLLRRHRRMLIPVDKEQIGEDLYALLAYGLVAQRPAGKAVKAG
jgi:TetR/AcrR family transcriptional regulator